ncbi:MAG: sugar phosphate isomerase/epimerase, partial [Yoonia sp.]
NPKILPLGKGEHDRAMLKTLIESGYTGPIGILDHQNHLDAKESLQGNLSGLARLKMELTR